MHQRRRDVAEQITDMFARDGFTALTADEASRRSGISRGTFFRWFSSKEDVVFVATEAASFDLAASLTAVSWEQTETMWSAIRRALDPLAQLAEDQPSRTRSRIRMILAVPSLRARLAEVGYEHEQRVGRAISSKFSMDTLQATVTAAITLTLVELAWRIWAANDKADFTEVLDDVMARVVAVGASPGGAAQ